MNLRNVLRAYGLLRQLSDDESALLNILRALNDNDREQLVASMSDKPQKKAGKKSAGGGGGASSKSARASGMAAQLNKSLQQQRKVTADDDGSELCGRMLGGESGLEPCEQRADHNIHHLKTHPGYHPFQSTAPPATSPSSANDEASTGTQNSGTQPGDAGDAHRVASGD